MFPVVELPHRGQRGRQLRWRPRQVCPPIQHGACAFIVHYQDNKVHRPPSGRNPTPPPLHCIMIRALQDPPNSVPLRHDMAPLPYRPPMMNLPFLTEGRTMTHSHLFEKCSGNAALRVGKLLQYIAGLRQPSFPALSSAFASSGDKYKATANKLNSQSALISRERLLRCTISSSFCECSSVAWRFPPLRPSVKFVLKNKRTQRGDLSSATRMRFKATD